MAFQIRDDILDLTGTQEELGKPVGSDEKNQKKTYPALYGMEQPGRQWKNIPLRRWEYWMVKEETRS